MGRCLKICFFYIFFLLPLTADSGRDRKRRRADAVEIEDRLESLILRVGEKVSSCR